MVWKKKEKERQEWHFDNLLGNSSQPGKQGKTVRSPGVIAFVFSFLFLFDTIATLPHGRLMIWWVTPASFNDNTERPRAGVKETLNTSFRTVGPPFLHGRTGIRTNFAIKRSKNLHCMVVKVQSCFVESVAIGGTSTRSPTRDYRTMIAVAIPLGAESFPSVLQPRNLIWPGQAYHHGWSKNWTR